MSIVAVAREAGVSVATVSRVFNFPDRVRPDTRGRVQAVARALGYRPNASAQTLRTQRSKAIGVVLPTLLNPVFAECLHGVAQAATAAGYSIVPLTTDYEVAQEDEAVDRLLALNVDGMILVVSAPDASSALKRLRKAGLPYVLAYNRHPGHPCVSVDSEQACAATVASLVKLGHRRIAMVSGQLAASDRAQQRHRGYLAGMKAARLAPKLLEVPFMDAAVEAIQSLVTTAPAPTALVCSNDLLAIRALRAARLAGLQVPRDVSVLGFDGIEIGKELPLELSTVVQPNRDIGASATRLLASALAADRALAAAASVTMPWTFRPGESCGAAPASTPTRSRANQANRDRAQGPAFQPPEKETRT